jgi:hypothetical protein
MPIYRVWDPDLESETEVIVDGGAWSHYEAVDEEAAAADLAQEMADSGDYSDHVSAGFDLHVRDLDTYKLYIIKIGFDWDPTAFVSSSREATLAEDKLVQ